jgi:hypothetical protein
VGDQELCAGVGHALRACVGRWEGAQACMKRRGAQRTLVGRVALLVARILWASDICCVPCHHATCTSNACGRLVPTCVRACVRVVSSATHTAQPNDGSQHLQTALDTTTHPPLLVLLLLAYHAGQGPRTPLAASGPPGASSV